MTNRAQRVRVTRLGARRELTLFIGLGLVVMLVVGVGGAFASRSVAQRQALDDAERITKRTGDLVKRPLSGFLARQPGSELELRRVIESRMSDGYLTEVTVWSADGQVLFSNEVENIGTWPQPVPAEVGTAIRGGTTSAFEDDPPEADPIQDPSGTTTDGERGPNRYVEVYTPLMIQGQPPMAFEAYYDYQQVEELSDALLSQTLPIVLGPLLLLQAIQIPLALSLGRRLKRHEKDRSRLLERALSASDQERVRFAADLHDGPIQDLAGISYALGAMASSVASQHAALMVRVQDALQRSIHSLRTLMTDLYPPDLRAGSLVEALQSLAEQARTAGLDVRVSVAELPPLSEEGTSTLYRVVRETLTNVQQHAAASKVTITLAPAYLHGTSPGVRLVVADDGVGLDPGRIDRRAEGHLGLRLLTDRVESLGGEMVITSAPLQGTSVEVELPASPLDAS